jgi:hypothetical protein
MNFHFMCKTCHILSSPVCVCESLHTHTHTHGTEHRRFTGITSDQTAVGVQGVVDKLISVCSMNSTMSVSLSSSFPLIIGPLFLWPVKCLCSVMIRLDNMCFLFSGSPEERNLKMNMRFLVLMALSCDTVWTHR